MVNRRTHKGIGAIRRFNGKIYYYYITKNTKKEAEKRAKQLREYGALARVVKYKSPTTGDTAWAIYITKLPEKKKRRYYKKPKRR